MLSRRRDEADLRARILRDAIEPVAEELQLIDVADYIACIRFEQFANIQDIVNSSIELFFRAETLHYAWAAEYELDWGGAPEITIAMEFRHRDVWIVFRLVLAGDKTRVSIEHFEATQSSGDLMQDTSQMIEALTDARVLSGAG
ncbi:conserved hypothetical protein [Methylocella tundrae]|uniref:Uncharacterized protein n=1 Tax=Methylocella tundrae TaxID=227605 RepID=A0A8B6M5B7_METTU|nr:conserved hypothetical protein [Methylocella tundrae]VTZ50028.1 conserved hypothetical protein [Methylocella tundrae]